MNKNFFIYILNVFFGLSYIILLFFLLFECANGNFFKVTNIILSIFIIALNFIIWDLPKIKKQF